MSTQAIEIVTPDVSDAESMASIAHEFWCEAAEAHGGNGGHGYNYDLAQMKLKLEDPDNEYLRVVRAGECAVGILCATPYNPHFDGAMVDLLALRPPYRGQGIGARLVHDFTEFVLPGLPIGVIPYGPRQEALESFYGRLGFVQSEEDEDYMIRQAGGVK